VTRPFALALGGGGARGLAHIVVLETLDALGLRPAMIAGTSMGAILGACYAAGHSGKQLRAHVAETFRDRTDVMTRLFRARVGKVTDFLTTADNPALVDAERLLALFLPRRMPDRFEDLDLPFAAVAGDLAGGRTRIFREGPLLPAVAASMAVPGLVRPVAFGGSLLIDGAVVDPVPFAAVDPSIPLVLAIGVTGAPPDPARGRPLKALEVTLGASLIMQHQLTRLRLAGAGERVRLIEAPLPGVAALDFFGWRKILAAAEPLREAVAAILTDPGRTPPDPREADRSAPDQSSPVSACP
jgi:NTE family protein